MAIQYTPYPIKTATGTATVKTAIDPSNPTTPPRIVDKNNNTLYEWNITNKKFEPLGSNDDVLPSGVGFSSTETFGALLNQNQETFTKNTTTIINKLPDNQKQGFKDANSYQPYNSLVEKQQAAAVESGSLFTLEDATTGIRDLSTLNQSISSAEIRTDYYNAGQPLKYPIDFPENQDRIKFTMYRYAPKKIGIGQNFGTFSGSNISTKDNQKEIFGSVFLPISPTISDQNTVNWGGDEMTALQALAAAASYGAIKNGVMGAEQSLRDVAKGLQNASPELKAAAAAFFAGEAAGGNKTFFSRVTGAVLNPNLELLFNGPQLRTFSFSFTLSAREEKESKEIRKIIRFFKQGMAVQRAKTNLFLKAPNIFDISYQLRETNEDHPWMNKIKTCALTNCNVNYTPAGNYATFYDGAMTAYELTLSFSEIDPIFEDDYTKLDENKDTMIGY